MWPKNEPVTKVGVGQGRYTLCPAFCLIVVLLQSYNVNAQVEVMAMVVHSIY